MLLPLDRDDATAFMSGDGDERFLEALLWHGLHSESDPAHARPLTQEKLTALSGLKPNSVKAYASTKLKGVLEPGRALSLDPNAGYALGVDFGRTHQVRVVLTDLRGSWDEKGMLPRGDAAADCDQEPTASAQNEAAVDRIWDVMESRNVNPSQIVAVGIGIATPSAPDINAGNAAFGQWKIWASGSLLRNALNERWEKEGKGSEAWSSVEFVDENDTNLSAIADHLWGSGQNCPNSLFVKWNAGVRAALILDGRLYTGSAGYAGELRHVKIPQRSEECGAATCTVEGRKGCLYGIAPIAKIAETARVKRVDEIVERAMRRDPLGEALHQTLKDAAWGIGAALAPLALGLNVEKIVIGGALGARAYPHVLESLGKGIESQARATELAIVNSTIRNRGTVRGAAALALLKFGPKYLKKAAARDATAGKENGHDRRRRRRARQPAAVS